MSKRAFKSQASSTRAASSAFGSASPAFGAAQHGFQTAASPLSYVAEQPDLSGISDPQVVVAFKNLGKRDSTTKSKALEDLQERLSTAAQPEGVESPVLDAWANLYPRTSIDNSRRVRQLAHALQGWLTASSGKRIVPYLPKTIGSWLAGTYDSDKGVARSAQDALQTAFALPEKQDAMWKVYRQALLDYVEDAMLVQSQQTLSDERTTSPDDSEAKHIRVVSTAALVLLQLVQRKSMLVNAKRDSNSEYAKLLSNNKLWEYAYHKNASMRRAVYALIQLVVTNLEDLLDFETISTCFLANALHIDQLGSAGQYLDAILALSEHRPHLWTADYTSKTTASRRLFQFIRKGSQRGPESFWTKLGQLIRIIPIQVWNDTPSPEETAASSQVSLKDAESLLEAIHKGVVNAEEPRQNLLAAWSTYASTALWLIRDLKVQSPQTLLAKQMLPIIQQYVSNASNDSQWSIAATTSLQICSRILVSLISSEFEENFSILWNNLSLDLVDNIKLSLPETSQDFTISQDVVIAQADRLFKLQQQVMRSISKESSARSTLENASTKIINDCIQILLDRKGKPYSAAGTILAAVMVVFDNTRHQRLESFLASDLGSLLNSPSGPILVSLLIRCRNYPSFPDCFHSCVKALLGDDGLSQSDDLLTRLLQEAEPSDLNRTPELVTFAMRSLDKALDGDSTRWKIVKALLGNKRLLAQYAINTANHSKEDLRSAETILSTMMNSLAIEDKQDAALTGFEGILSDKIFIDGTILTHTASQLLPKLILASDSSNEDTARRATELGAKLRSVMKKSDSSTIATSTSHLLRQQFEGSGHLMSIYGMIELAEQVLRESESSQLPELVATLLPSAEQWRTALEPFISQPPSAASAITSPLQGVVYTINSTSPKTLNDLPRDTDEFSIAMRLAVYVTKLLKDEVISITDCNPSTGLYLYYPQVLQLINEKITIDSANTLWLSSTPELTEEAVNTLSQGQKLIRTWAQESTATPEDNESLIGVWYQQWKNMQGTSPQTYILGLCFSDIIAAHLNVSTSDRAPENYQRDLSSMRLSNDIVRSAALVLILQDTPPGSTEGIRLCNELVTDATQLRNPGTTVADLRPLILLNMLLYADSGLLSTISSQRVVFLLQNLVRILALEETPYAIQSEIYKLLYHVVFAASYIYGEHWEQILDAIGHLWEDHKAVEDLPVLNSSLLLYSCLRSLRVEKANEDLLDAWILKRSGLESALIHMLLSWNRVDIGVNQPRDITAESLVQHLLKVDGASLESFTELYALLRSEQYSVQCAAFDLLQRAIPAKQEQISLDIALEKKAAHLPAALLSLISSPGTVEGTVKTLQTRDMNSTRGYLFCWTIMFDHFTNASFKLKEMYHADLKGSSEVPALLDMICNILRITSGRPVDGSRFDITTIGIDYRDPTEFGVHWMAIHLYYQALLNAPDLVKEWYIGQKNRVKSPLASWTQKHISPEIIEASLEAVTDWAATQDQDDRPVSIKSSTRASEVVASITIDEESPPISLTISLPGAYPLEQAIVSSRNRVGVSEKNWQSWLRTFQIIIFSSNNLVEGLIAFRRNLQGALKGQTECAICYSIIGTDMKTPDKKCGTCKNTFHSVCLFRWFRSSNSSSCPLCRNNFNYA